MQLSAAARANRGAPVPAPIAEWSSSDPRVAAISPTGVVRGVTPGRATISARTAGGPAGSLSLEVLAALVAKVSVGSHKEALAVGESVALTAVVQDSEGRALADRTIAWTSGNPRVAAITPAGRVTALAAGTATITATADGVPGTVDVTVRAAGAGTRRSWPRREWLALGAAVSLGLVVWLVWPRSRVDRPPRRLVVRVSPAQLTLTVGDSAGIRAEVLGGTRDSARVGWTSSDTGVAAVSALGVVRGRRPGGASVTAHAGSAHADTRVTVIPPRPAAVALVVVAPRQLRLGLNRRARLRATARDSTGAVLVGRAAEWSSSDPAVAHLSPGGVVTAMAPGSATVTAMVDEVPSEPVTVTVGQPSPAAVRPGTVRMIVSPWAWVAIDGEARGQRVSGTDTLSALVRHRLRFARDGFTTVDTTLTLRPGEERSLHIRLQPRQP